MDGYKIVSEAINKSLPANPNYQIDITNPHDASRLQPYTDYFDPYDLVKDVYADQTAEQIMKRCHHVAKSSYWTKYFIVGR